MRRAHRGARPRIGISSCLLGRRVRYDGNHERDSFLVRSVGPHVEWVPVCPELEAGMGVPREAIQLVRRGRGAGRGPRLLGVESGKDWTGCMTDFARARARQIDALGLDGYVFKSKSPSCGLEGVKVHAPPRRPRRCGRGLFAEAVVRRLPRLPVVEEWGLGDPAVREHFFECVFAHRRWKRFEEERYSARRLAEFHHGHEPLLDVRSPARSRELQRIAAQAREARKREVVPAYESLFFETMARPASAAGHLRVLRRVAALVRGTLDAGGRGELAAALDAYGSGRAPRLVPQTLLAHHLQRARIPGVLDTYYFSPGAAEQALLAAC